MGAAKTYRTGREGYDEGILFYQSYSNVLFLSYFMKRGAILVYFTERRSTVSQDLNLDHEMKGRMLYHQNLHARHII